MTVIVIDTIRSETPHFRTPDKAVSFHFLYRYI